MLRCAQLRVHRGTLGATCRSNASQKIEVSGACLPLLHGAIVDRNLLVSQAALQLGELCIPAGQTRSQRCAHLFKLSLTCR